LINIAYAMGQSGSSQGSGGFASFVPIILMFAVFYFLLIRPQQKKSKDLAEMVRNLKKGDRIIISGGIIGRITGLSDSTLTAEIADKVRVKVARGSVTLMDPPSVPDKQIKK
jgi:preprotein translocase subunit YajC